MGSATNLSQFWGAVKKKIEGLLNMEIHTLTGLKGREEL